MAEDAKVAAKGWTEAEKLGILFQIIVRSGTIPWDDIELPEGRTRKACQVMVDKEKQKVKKWMAENGKELPAVGTPKATPGKKRKNVDADKDDGENGGEGSKTPSKKAAKGGRKKKPSSEDLVEDDSAEVKAEEAEEE